MPAAIRQIPDVKRLNDYVFSVPVNKIEIKEGHNPRNWWDTKKAIVIDDLVAFVEANGVTEGGTPKHIPPIVVKVKDGRITLVAGERRTRTAQALQFHEGLPGGKLTHLLAVQDTGSSDQDLFLSAMHENAGLKLSDLEMAYAYKRLRDEWGWDVKAIRTHFGVSGTEVEGKLKLVDTPEVVKAVQNKEISLTQGVKAARQVQQRDNTKAKAPAVAIAEVKAGAKPDGRKTRYSDPKPQKGDCRQELEALIEKYGAPEVKRVFRQLLDED